MSDHTALVGLEGHPAGQRQCRFDGHALDCDVKVGSWQRDFIDLVLSVACCAESLVDGGRVQPLRSPADFREHANLDKYHQHDKDDLLHEYAPYVFVILQTIDISSLSKQIWLADQCWRSFMTLDHLNLIHQALAVVTQLPSIPLTRIDKECREQRRNRLRLIEKEAPVGKTTSTEPCEASTPGGF
jgi:hypothetical protein